MIPVLGDEEKPLKKVFIISVLTDEEKPVKKNLHDSRSHWWREACKTLFVIPVLTDEEKPVKKVFVIPAIQSIIAPVCTGIQSQRGRMARRVAWLLDLGSFKATIAVCY